MMARIRSVHPGLWTDEQFVSCSPLARLLLIGLWGEADDQGVFEWKPVGLKMRLMPMDHVEVVDLLDELEAINAIREFEVSGRNYGAIRNFRKFQRPKSPSAVHPLPPEFRNYVGLTDTNGETGGGNSGSSGQNGETPTVNRGVFPRKGETAPQMEDGGGRMEDEGGEERSANADSSPDGDVADVADEGAKVRVGREVRYAFDSYNLTAERLGLPIAKTLTEERRKKIRARLRAA